MPLQLSHWDNPLDRIGEQQRIHNTYEGMFLLTYLLRALDLRPSDLRKMKVLDYGCGIARVGKPASMFFGELVAWDPNTECMKLARELAEADSITTYNFTKRIKFIDDFNKIQKNSFDLIFACHVLEHLNPVEISICFQHFNDLIKPTGVLHINYNVTQIRTIQKFTDPTLESIDKMLINNKPVTLIGHLFAKHKNNYILMPDQILRNL